MNRTLLRYTLSLSSLIFLLAHVTLHAQSGTVAGRVVDSTSGEPLNGATIRLFRADGGGRQIGAIANRSGEYRIVGVQPGRYRLTITFVSASPFERDGVEVRASETTTVNAALVRNVIGLGEVIVTASRRPEKITSAPASVSVVDARSIQEQPSLSIADHLRGVTGLDIVQSGISQNMVVARGFNNAFSGTLAVLTDNRIASVPSLRFNAYNFIPLVNEDIQQIEVVRGPGAALYGPNTANGVMHTITRSPLSSQGTWLSASVGERDLFQGMVRHAGMIGDRLGYKISGQYMTATDWGLVDSVEVSSRRAFLADTITNGHVRPDTLKIGLRDSLVQRLAGEIRIDYIPVDDLSLIFSAGLNDAIRNPEITGVGGAMARDWTYSYYQLRALYKDLFVQAFLNKSSAGGSYLLRTGVPVVDRSSLFVAQVQHNYMPVEDELRLTYGVDLLLTTPVTDSTITGVHENDDDILEVGGYLQGEWIILPDKLTLIGAGRLDKHSRLDDVIFSPRAALVYQPFDNQSLRLTFNRAYSAPTTNDMFLDLLARRTVAIDVRASGLSRSGFTFRTASDGSPLMRSKLHPDHSAYLPLDSARGNGVWHGVQGLINNELKKLGSTATFDSVAAPPASVGLQIRTLNQLTAAFDSSGPPMTIPGIRPTITSTIELGYQGVLFDRIALGVDLYRSHYTDFLATVGVITPNVFYEQSSLETYLRSELLRVGFATDSAQSAFFAQLLSSLISGTPGDTSNTGVPLGTISPEQAVDPTAIIAAPRNYGSITLYGYDLSLQVGITEELTVGGNLSYVDNNFFPNLEGISDLALNAPKFKFSLSADYRDPSLGFNCGVRLRHVDGFPVRSGDYIGSVAGYSVVDLSLGYDIPFIPGLNATVSASNLLTFVEGRDTSPFELRHAEFIGTPELGRMTLLRLTYGVRD